MPAVKRSKTNSKYFDDIPKKEKPPVEEVLSLLKRKYDLKSKRDEMQQWMRQKRKELYNITHLINEYEMKIDKILVQRLTDDERTERIVLGAEDRLAV